MATELPDLSLPAGVHRYEERYHFTSGVILIVVLAAVYAGFFAWSVARLVLDPNQAMTTMSGDRFGYWSLIVMGTLTGLFLGLPGSPSSWQR